MRMAPRLRTGAATLRPSYLVAGISTAMAGPLIRVTSMSPHPLYVGSALRRSCSRIKPKLLRGAMCPSHVAVQPTQGDRESVDSRLLPRTKLVRPRAEAPGQGVGLDPQVPPSARLVSVPACAGREARGGTLLFLDRRRSEGPVRIPVSRLPAASARTQERRRFLAVLVCL